MLLPRENLLVIIRELDALKTEFLSLSRESQQEIKARWNADVRVAMISVLARVENMEAAHKRQGDEVIK